MLSNLPVSVLSIETQFDCSVTLHTPINSHDSIWASPRLQKYVYSWRQILNMPSLREAPLCTGIRLITERNDCSALFSERGISFIMKEMECGRALVSYRMMREIHQKTSNRVHLRCISSIIKSNLTIYWQEGIIPSFLTISTVPLWFCFLGFILVKRITDKSVDECLLKWCSY